MPAEAAAPQAMASAVTSSPRAMVCGRVGFEDALSYHAENSWVGAYGPMKGAYVLQFRISLDRCIRG